MEEFIGLSIENELHQDGTGIFAVHVVEFFQVGEYSAARFIGFQVCLLYTSDAADE